MNKQIPHICGEKGYLRAMESADVELYAEAMNDARLGKIGGFPFPQSRSNFQHWYDKVMNDSYGKDGFYFSACRWEDNAVVGFAWLYHLDYWIGQGEYAIVLSKVEYLNQGYGTDITRSVLDFGFGTVGLQRIYLSCSADDPRPAHCYQKARFVIEGRQRHVRRQNGLLADCLMMSILREEWDAMKIN